MSMQQQYITAEEFKDFTGEEAPDNFKYLEMRARAELDTATRFHFRTNEFTDDFISQQFKQAMVVQVQFYIEMETTSSEAMNAKPDSVRIGDTTVSYNRSGNATERSRRDTALSQDAVNLLRGTGLLYRGGVQYGS
jgi:hypothetical protein